MELHFSNALQVANVKKTDASVVSVKPRVYIFQDKRDQQYHILGVGHIKFSFIVTMLLRIVITSFNAPQKEIVEN